MMLASIRYQRSVLQTVSLFLVFVVISSCGGTSSSSSLPPPSITVAISPAAAKIYQGATAQFYATVDGTSNQAVTWSVQDNFGTIDSTGFYTAPKDASGGPENVIATSKASSDSKGLAQVTILPVTVAVDPPFATLGPNGTTTFTAVVDGPSHTVSWALREPTGGKVNAIGAYTAPASVGFYHVIASTSDGVQGHATVTVTASTGKFTPTGITQGLRQDHTATLLADGTVLLVGGSINEDFYCTDGTRSAELYDSAGGTSASTADISTERYWHTATLLQNGRVLVAGGFGKSKGGDCIDVADTPTEASAELFDPGSGSFTATSSMKSQRASHTATLLANGKVLVAGGWDYSGNVLGTAEIYDPATGKFVATGSLVVPRYSHTATLLPGGKVLIVGGGGSRSSAVGEAEIYDPLAGTFSSAGNLGIKIGYHTATGLADGAVLIAGGTLFNADGSGTPVANAEIYDPGTGLFSPTGPMLSARVRHTSTLLPDGTVLIAGGFDPGDVLPTAEVYDPTTRMFTPTASMQISRVGHSATLLNGGQVLVVGGLGSRVHAELYTP
jgi:hypothetical protein